MQGAAKAALCIFGVSATSAWRLASGLGREDPASRSESLMRLPAVGHFLDTFAGQHFEHSLDAAHA